MVREAGLPHKGSRVLRDERVGRDAERGPHPPVWCSDVKGRDALHARGRKRDELAQNLTVQRESYRMSIRALSMGASMVNRLGLPFGKIDEASLLQSARRATGLDDWGGEYFLEPMRRLLADVESGGITALARISTRDVALKHLTNRLELTEQFRKHPELNDLAIERPLFILGFPRTGTTLLQNLLGLDTQRRALPFWEIATPVPVCEDPAEDKRRRVKDINRKLDVAYFVVPEMEQVHEIRAETFEECWPLLANSFTVPNWEMSSRWTNYGSWLLDHDMVPAYQEYKQCLQVMTQRVPGTNLVLKCPDHLATLDALLEVFPDACIVWTHRDPVDCIASYCSMVSLNWRLLYGRYDPKEIGGYITDRFLRWVERAMEVRDKVGSERFFDVDFGSLVANPVAVVDGISEHFGLAPISSEAIEGYLSTERSDERGKHVYSVGRYGVDPDHVHDIFQDYIQRFSIPVRNAAARM